MKKTGLLHPAVSHVIASMGHTDGLVVCDAGLPIPEGPERIDVAVSPGVPSFLQVLDAITGELQVERVLIAGEFQHAGRDLYPRFVAAIEALGRAQGRTIAIDRVSHEDFKRTTASARAVVRTGECTPYANVILYAGVTF
ncbi:D-ribose pyranase [Caenispirillum bisanense]|uniref:D-ribose pyranase n=1 Tax=Caenispirillum bisanense TaxID=414052 RepID=UPI0031CF3F09